MILHRIRESYVAKGMAAYLAISMLFQIIYPTAAMALTGGPSQPEVQSFSPVGTSDMVNLSSGDFNYNIPLLDVGGYPINMVYNGGITMDQEASWVGLGWNINPGVINRNMRGLPDDFNGDPIKNQTYMKPNNTIGLSLGLGFDEFFGTSPNLGSVGISTSLNMGITYNNYNGVSLSTGVGFSPNKGNFEGDLGLSASPGGLSVNASVSYDKNLQDKLDANDGSRSGSIGLGFNSRAGLTDMNIKTSLLSSKEKKGTGEVYSLGATINLVPNTYTPQIDHERTSFNASFSIKPEGTVFGIDAAATIGANYSRQKLVSNGETVATPAYGYLASEKARYASQGHSLMDFNREKDGGFTNGTTNLPITNYTYDAYSISGQGVAGSYRPYRSEVGHVHDNRVVSKSFSGNGSFEAGGGQLFDLGVNMRVNPSTSYSGDWVTGNNAWDKFNFINYWESFADGGNEELYEPYYYKQSGELTVDNDPLFGTIKDYRAVQLELNDNNVGAFNVELENKLSENGTGSGTTALNSKDLQRKERVNRNQLISTLNDQEVSILKPWRTRSPWAEPHHVSEVSVTKNDGGRYIYGLAAYNSHQEDVTFALSVKGENTDGDCHTGLVSYTPGIENKQHNKRGNDEFFSKTTLPPFAHSYLLTEVLSHDYIDVNENGADDADYGTYTRFEYDKVADYKWRVPFDANKANYNEGLKSDYSDEKGSYVYGKKDLHYLNKIETKTHVAIFHTNEDGVQRSDAKSTANSDGGIGSGEMKRLDRITLYSKGDWNANYTGNGDYSNLTPIKEVHFVYAPAGEELCQGNLPNAVGTRGKLTLQQVYFTYGNSNKAKWSPYTFEYNTKNPSYNLKGYNVWGGYKENANSNCDPTSPLTNAEFPYVEQNKTEADNNVNAWALKSIKLPSGGKINIEYESDDYAYVQDKQAMQMFKVIGACDDSEFNASTPYDVPVAGRSEHDLFTRTLTSFSDKVNNYLFFKLSEEDQTASGITPAYIQEKYGLKGDEKLQFRFLMDITDKDTDYEYISGYCEVDQRSLLNGTVKGYGVIQSSNLGGENVGYVVVNPVKLSDEETTGRYSHPIAKAGWNFTRSFLPKIAFGLPNNFPSDDESNNGIKNLAKTLAQANIMHQVKQFVKGPNNSLRLKDYSKSFMKEKSWIRLTNPNGRKLGGGSRVKRIVMSDEWSTMVSSGAGETSVYGQEYSYDSEEEIINASGNKVKISSGVATYEPTQSKENPFIQPVFMTVKHLLAPNENNYIEEPFGESFFPSPTVTYSRVEVKNIEPVGVDNNQSGKVVHEFYTSRDYPTITKRDVMSSKRKGVATQLLSVITGVKKDFMTASQGYSIINNDMDGKQKAQWVLADGVNDISDAISGVEYVYNLNGTSVMPSATDQFIQTTVNTDAKQLNNNCVLIHKNGEVKSGTIGIEFDAVADFRENKTDSETYGANMGLNGFLLGIFPGLLPSVIPSKTSDHTRFRSAVFTKVINQHGILREVVAHDLGAKVSTKNLAWDAETGEVLLTSVKNEYADEIFTLNYPAHWGYDKMGMASQNIGLETKINNTSPGWYANSNTGAYFVKGDEILLNNQTRAWVLKVNSTSLFLIDAIGNPATVTGNNISAKVIRSGRRNQQALAIGSITMKEDPIQVLGSGYKNLNQVFDSDVNVLAASAVEYDDNWRTYAGVNEEGPSSSECVCTPDQKAMNCFEDIINNAFAAIICNCEVKTDEICADFSQFKGLKFSDFTLSAIAGTNKLVLNHPSFKCPFVLEFENYIFETNDLSFLSNNCINENSKEHTECGFDFFGRLEYKEENCGKDVAIIGEFLAPLPGLDGKTSIFKILGPSECFPPFFNCETITTPSSCIENDCDLVVGDRVNPFVAAIKGIWRTKKSSLFLAERNQTNQAVYTNNPNSNLDLRKDGSYTTFEPFWSYTNKWKPSTSGNWTWASQITNYTPIGQEVENQDALFRYSAATFGYNYSLATAVANNAQQNQIAFDGFEDYNFNQGTNCSNKKHFGFICNKNQITDDEAHSGRNSIVIKGSSGAVGSTSIVSKHQLKNVLTPIQNVESGATPYILRTEDVINTFGPATVFNAGESGYNQASVEYVFSYWQKEATVNNEVIDYSNIVPSVKVNGSELLTAPYSKSKIIDGWQKVEYRFKILNNSIGKIEISFADTQSLMSFVDDIRIHPFNSSMKSYVYDPISLRLWAELDDNNYATFYEYDEEGKLLRIKKETARGIQTIQESRSSSVK